MASPSVGIWIKNGWSQELKQNNNQKGYWWTHVLLFVFHQWAKNNICGKADSCSGKLPRGVLVWAIQETRGYVTCPSCYDWTNVENGVKPLTIKLKADAQVITHVHLLYTYFI